MNKSLIHEVSKTNGWVYCSHGQGFRTVCCEGNISVIFTKGIINSNIPLALKTVAN